MTPPWNKEPGRDRVPAGCDVAASNLGHELLELCSLEVAILREKYSISGLFSTEFLREPILRDTVTLSKIRNIDVAVTP